MSALCCSRSSYCLVFVVSLEFRQVKYRISRNICSMICLNSQRTNWMPLFRVLELQIKVLASYYIVVYQ
jgi:hypothetical protein